MIRLLALLAALTLGAAAGPGILACTGPDPAGQPSAGPTTAEATRAGEGTSQGWLVTVYYTAVESFHGGQAVTVTGCPQLQCSGGDDVLGRYPRGFADAVREEGTGRITSGVHAGRYLNWSHNVGYWLDTAPRDAQGRPLQPFRSAAADGLPDGARLALVDCGRSDSGTPVPAEVCTALRAGQWEIRDQFTPGLGGPRHIDLYIGEETQPRFTSTAPLYVTLHDAVFADRT